MEATGEAMTTLATPSFDGIAFECPNCNWRVTMTFTVDWEMRKIDKVMNKHIHWCKKGK